MVSLLWFSTYIFKVKTPRQKVYMWILALGAYYFATYSSYINPQGDYLTMVKMDVVNVPVIFLLLSLITLYVSMHLKPHKYETQGIILSFMPAAVLGAIVATLYYLVGFDNAARLVECYDKGLPRPADLDTNLIKTYIFFDETLPNILSMAFLVCISAFCVVVMKRQGYHFGDVFRFFFKGHQSTPSRVIAFLQLMFFVVLSPMAFVGREYLYAHPALGAASAVLLAVAMHFIAFVEYFSSDGQIVTLHDLSHISSGDDSGDDSNGDEKEAPAAEAANEDSTPRRSHRSDILMEKVVALFEEEEIFRKDNVTLEMVSQLTGIGRTMLSSLINQHYGVPFRDVVNRYRVDAVKRYLLANPSATQESAAFHCGFKDASSLNRKFREIEGETPLMWLTHHQAG